MATNGTQNGARTRKIRCPEVRARNRPKSDSVSKPGPDPDQTKKRKKRCPTLVRVWLDPDQTRTRLNLGLFSIKASPSLLKKHTTHTLRLEDGWDYRGGDFGGCSRARGEILTTRKKIRSPMAISISIISVVSSFSMSE